MNRGAWQRQIVQVVIDQIGILAAIDKHKSTRRWHGDEQIVEGFHLETLLNIDNLNETSESWKGEYE
jgi:hypothetical protein